jgi:hypothetical protein
VSGLESDSSVFCRFLPKPAAAINTIRANMKVRIPFFIGITILGYKDKAETIKGVKSADFGCCV